jgi:hypothetical protein
MPHYTESVPAPRWLLLVAAVAGVAMVGGGVAVLASDETRSVGWVLLVAVLVAAGLAMGWVIWTFRELRIEVSDSGARFGFNRLAKSLDADEMIEATAERYPWKRYGGWGVRVSTGGYRAYSQAFERESVLIYAADGHHYHVSSRRPAELAEAINRVASAEQSTVER